MTPSAPILDARSIRKSFRMGDSEIDVLKGVDFAVHEGEFVAIEGRSGSGKSTLLHILGSLESLGDGTTAYSGSEYTLREPPAEAWLLSRLRSLPMAVVNELSSIIAQILLVMKVVTKEQMTVWCLLVAVGIICQLLALSYLVAITLHWWRWREYRRQQRRAAGLRNRAFGFVFQFYHLLPELNVLENVMLPAMVEYSFFRYLAKRRELRQRAIDILTELGLSHRLKHRSSQLSGGERQRVGDCPCPDELPPRCSSLMSPPATSISRPAGRSCTCWKCFTTRARPSSWSLTTARSPGRPTVSSSLPKAVSAKCARTMSALTVSNSSKGQ